ncbi:cyclin-dependent protein kinase inhibitor [Chiua virens]|nr:cyclin-dependent protein kinase inhibitor [Chiua virens]
MTKPELSRVESLFHPLMEFLHDIGGDDPLKPSLFELIAQEQLRDLLQPALKYVLAVFAQRYPRYLIRIVNRHEEFYAMIMFFVERHYLRKHNASFAENFYGLKRRRHPWISIDRAAAAVRGAPAAEKLRNHEIWQSLFFLVAVPYLRAKSQDYYERLGGGISSDILEDAGDSRRIQALTDDSLARRWRRAYKKIFPWVNTSFELWLLACNVAYLFERTPFYRPWLAWIGVDLRRLSADDFVSIPDVPHPNLIFHRQLVAGSVQGVVPHARRGIMKKVYQLLFHTPQLILDSLRLLLPTAIFFIKFLEWWYSPGSPARSLSISPLGPAVPPPRMLPPHPSGIPVDGTMFGHCPLCQNVMNNATALPSGYVFCYRCAFDYVEQYGKCPVTLLPAKFGKQIQSEQVPGWSAYYLDYKFLKKIISSLTANRPASEAAALALGVRPADLLNPTGNPAIPSDNASSDTPPDDPNQLPILSSLGQDSDRGADFHAHKAAFFFKLERELEKINTFYLQKEAELKLRLETLLSKRRAAALRGLPDATNGSEMNHVEWIAVEEGFRLLERDLGKLQQFVEMNATGFRKILKKWDKRSRSATKELYLARQVEVQPVFNRQLIADFSDIVAASLLDLTDLSTGLKFEGSAAQGVLDFQLSIERNMYSGPFREFEFDLRKAVENSDEASIKDLVRHSDILGSQEGGKPNVTRVLWKVIVDAPTSLADLILDSVGVPFDFGFIDDINGRTCLHEAAAAGYLRLVNLCLEKGSQREKLDVYGRSALHYAAMHGHAAVCKRLLEAGVPPARTRHGQLLPGRICDSQSLEPLSLASQYGHADVVSLLLKGGAKCTPNSNGEYPVHLAAREGHVEVCKLLLDQEGWDLPDKYHEWTPLFHAARNGHSPCLSVLLQAGARVDRTDELDHQAIHYAAWHGHRACVDLLLRAMPKVHPVIPSYHIPVIPRSASAMQIDDPDSIPSLSLPPPIMPHRVYGHNYLDKNYLVVITSVSLPSPNRLKMVITAGPGVNAAPYTITLPQKNNHDTLMFQASGLKDLTLEFSIYPNFGTKTIGRAVAHPYIFHSPDGSFTTSPILDHRLHSIGELLVAPYTLALALAFNPVPPWRQSPKSMDSTHTSPSIHSTPASPSHTVTLSSLSGNYVYAIIQVTKDSQPVLYGEQLLPESSYDLGVADVTLAQFDALANRVERGEQLVRKMTSIQDWYRILPRVMLPLSRFMQLLPAQFGLTLELALPPSQLNARPPELNLSVNSVLRTIRQTSSSLGGAFARRRIAFTSFSPQVCAALNWKQPNYPVFFSSKCGQTVRDHGSSSTNPDLGDTGDDQYSLSVAEGVDFAKANNLLGVFFDSELLLQVPSLIQGIRDAGLLVGIHGGPSSTNVMSRSAENAHVDAYVHDGTVVYTDPLHK